MKAPFDAEDLDSFRMNLKGLLQVLFFINFLFKVLLASEVDCNFHSIRQLFQLIYVYLFLLIKYCLLVVRI